MFIKNLRTDKSVKIYGGNNNNNNNNNNKSIVPVEVIEKMRVKEI